MAHLWLQVMPSSAVESRVVYAESWAEHELKKNPKDYAAELTLGSLALARLDARTAVGLLEEAVVLKPGDPIAHNRYGSAFAASGRNIEAREQFEDSVNLKPDFANARLNLAHALAQAGVNDEAIRNLQRILKVYPS